MTAARPAIHETRRPAPVDSRVLLVRRELVDDLAQVVAGSMRWSSSSDTPPAQRLSSE